MIDSNELSALIVRFKDNNVDKGLISKIINNYSEYPQYIIKYLTVYYPELVAKYIIKYIVSTKEKNTNILTSILKTYDIKLCSDFFTSDDLATKRKSVSVFKSFACPGVVNENANSCMCSSKVYWDKIYKGMIELLTIKKHHILNNNVIESLISLLNMTGVLDDKLYVIVKDLSIDPKYWHMIIRLITKSELYGKDYGDIIYSIRDILTKHDNKKNDTITAFASKYKGLLITALNNYNNIQMNVTKIINGLYIGDINVSKNVSILRDKKIRHIVTLTKKDIFRISNINYTQILIDDVDSENFITHTIGTFDDVINTLKKNRNVLVHCYKGLSRSVCYVILLLIRMGYTYDQAYKKVKDKRKKLFDPNPGFIEQIKDYYDTINIANNNDNVKDNDIVNDTVNDIINEDDNKNEDDIENEIDGENEIDDEKTGETIIE